MSETKDKLLDAAQKLMLAKGYTATTVDEICAAAGVTKGSFFHYFAGKEDIAKATAEHFLEMQQRVFGEAKFREFDDPLDRIHGRLDLLVEIARNPKMPKSCLIGNFAQELSSTHPEIRNYCQCAFLGAAEDFERDLVAAKKRYAPRSSLDPTSVARLYISLIQGSMILAKAAQNAAVLEDNVEHFRKYINLLLGRSR